MKGEEEIERRRRFLLQALSTGMLVGGVGWNSAAASWFGNVPRKMPEGKSIFDMQGEVLVNGKQATLNTLIRPGDKVTTGDNGSVIMVMGSDSLTLRAKSVLETTAETGRDAVVGAMRLITGGMLAVFGKRNESQLRINTPTATMGIRGTGVYTEVDAEKTYFCTCYGTTDIASAVDARDAIQVTSKHHDAAKYILAAADGGKRVIPAPFKNHTDLELMTLEALVGRKVPFGVPGGDYGAPHREYGP